MALGDKTELVSDRLTMSVVRKQNSIFEIKISSKDPMLDIKLEFDYNQNPSNIWTTPLSNDLKSYFATMKKPVTVTGSYTLNNKQTKCQGNDCFMMIDVGRGHFNYGVAYFWVLIMTTLKDGREVHINLGDGIGSEYRSLEKATEDFIIVDGKHYKMDVTEMDYYKDNYMGKKVIRTAQETKDYKKIFPSRHCELSFEPIGMIEEGVNAGLIAMKQYLTYGSFKGECNIDGEIIPIDNSYGHVEHVFSRW